MMKRLVMALQLVAISMVMGCVHKHPVDIPPDYVSTPVEAAPLIQEGIHVGIGSKEVKVGDRLKVLKTHCKREPHARGGKKRVCHVKQVGEATVIKVLDNESAFVRPEHDLVMDNSMRVEKQ